VIVCLISGYAYSCKREEVGGSLKFERGTWNIKAVV